MGGFGCCTGIGQVNKNGDTICLFFERVLFNNVESRRNSGVNSSRLRVLFGSREQYPAFACF